MTRKGKAKVVKEHPQKKRTTQKLEERRGRGRGGALRISEVGTRASSRLAQRRTRTSVRLAQRGEETHEVIL